jgi:hypothetical protein
MIGLAYSSLGVSCGEITGMLDSLLQSRVGSLNMGPQWWMDPGANRPGAG